MLKKLFVFVFLPHATKHVQQKTALTFEVFVMQKQYVYFVHRATPNYFT